MKTKGYGGFTLIEIMVVVVVLAILAAIALPSYRGVVLKSRRAYAMEALEGLRLAQEKFRANCVVYANSIVGAGVGTVCDPAVPTYQIEYPAQFSGGDGGWGYNISFLLPPADGVSYHLVARPFGDQLKDTKCGMFAADQDGPLYAHAGTNYADSTCWNR